ncbi:MAG: hypothetical protein KDA66_15450 [Planctomycetaceae bacterium]|nr:hypothetical protein [Planctomycetaceae bacterium]
MRVLSILTLIAAFQFSTNLPAEEPELWDDLKTVIAKLQPEATVTQSDADHFVMQYNVRPVERHVLLRSGPSHTTTSRETPVGPGFLVDISVHRVDYLPGWEFSMTGLNYVGVLFGEDCCLRYQNAFRLRGEQGYLVLSYYCGESADPRILKTVKEKLRAATDEIYPDKVSTWPATRDEIKERLNSFFPFQAQDVETLAEENVLTYQYHVQEYEFHKISEDGTVAEEAHRETGPAFDGFIVRISNPKPRPLTAVQPNLVREKGPYWRRFYCMAPVRKSIDKVEIEILYGPRTSGQKLEHLLDELVPVVRFPEAIRFDSWFE